MGTPGSVDGLITAALKSAYDTGYREGYRVAMEQVSGLTANIAAQHTEPAPGDELAARRAEKARSDTTPAG